MKAISLHQPFASSLFVSSVGNLRPPVMIKTHETRKRRLPPKYLGIRVAIHAALADNAVTRYAYEDAIASSKVIAESFQRAGITSYDKFPRGCIIGTIVFEESELTEKVMHAGKVRLSDRILGDWRAGRYCWRGKAPHELTGPIPCRGFQGWFNVDFL